MVNQIFIKTLTFLALAVFLNTTGFSQLSYQNYISHSQFKQKPSVSAFKDSIVDNKITPKQIMWRSIIIPGWGQITNKDYWKLPILYVGLGACVYSISYNYKYYDAYRDGYILRNDGDSTTIDDFDPLYNTGEVYTNTQLKYWRDYHRRNFELSVIVITAVYILNVLDAYVSGHLKDFDISDDLTLQMKLPEYNYNYVLNNHYISTGFVLKF